MFGMSRAKVFATMLLTMDFKKIEVCTQYLIKNLNESKIPLLYKYISREGRNLFFFLNLKVLKFSK